MLSNSVIKTDVVDGLKALDSNSIDIIISDPPYNIGKDFGECKDSMELTEYIDWCNQWIDESMRVLKPTGTFYIYGFSEILAQLFVHSKADFKRWIVWHYTNKNSATAKFWQRSHESIIVLGHQKPTFNEDLVREPYTDTFLENSAGKKRTATAGRFSNGKKETVYKAHEGGALPRDVIKHPTLAGGAGSKERAHWCNTCDALVVGIREKRQHEGHDLETHPTQKPIPLTRKLIAAAKNIDAETNVVVLFSGSGAESVAAIQENCNFTAFDINDQYLKMAGAWIKREQSGQSWLEDDIDETLSNPLDGIV